MGMAAGAILGSFPSESAGLGRHAGLSKVRAAANRTVPMLLHQVTAGTDKRPGAPIACSAYEYMETTPGNVITGNTSAGGKG